MKNNEIIIKQIKSIIKVVYKISVCEYSPDISTKTYSINGGTKIFSIENPNFNSEFILKDMYYQEMWSKMNSHKQYVVKMIDGALINFLYKFDYKSQELLKSRLSFFPSYDNPNFDDMPEEYKKDYLNLEAYKKTSYPSAIRFDYDEVASKSIVHPSSHLTLGQFKNCRIPVNSPLTPFNFMEFIIRNFYNAYYEDWKNNHKEIEFRNFIFKESIKNEEKKYCI